MLISDKILESGISTFDIHFILPEDLPSTFRSSIAKVEYYAKLSVKGIYRTKTKRMPFTVFERVNLNHLDVFTVSLKLCRNIVKLIL